jgi:hypothetical protein
MLPASLAALRAGLAREAAREREGDGYADGGGREVVPREPRHLREVAHRALAAVVLPVRVGREADGRVPGEIGWNGPELLRVEGQHVLQPLDGVRHEQAEGAEEEHRDRVALPAVLPLWIDPAEPIH